MDTNICQKALAELCQIYWPPIYAFLRRSGRNQQDSEDLTQEFFSSILSADLFGNADPSKGRLRSYLIGALKRFLSKSQTFEGAQKRGGSAIVVSFSADAAENAYQMEPSDPMTPESVFERRWALVVIEAALARLREDYVAAGKEQVFVALEPYLSWNSGEDFGGAAEKLSITEGSVRVAVHRIRKRFREFIRHEVADTIAPGEDLADEIRAVFLALTQ